MMKLYGFDLSTPSNKVRLCANAIGCACDYVRLDLPGGDLKSPDHLARHPAGKVPVIEDDGFVLFESDAINRYLCRKHDAGLYPSGAKEQAHVDQWCDFSTIHVGGAMGRVFTNFFIAPRFGMEVDQGSLDFGRAMLDRFLPIVDRQLEDNNHLAGEALSIADMSLLAIIDPAEVIELDLAQYPALNVWRERLRSQSFYTAMHKAYGESLMAA